MTRKLVPLAFAAALALSGCEEEAPSDTSATGGKAAGEVLGGTISDDMIPLDELTSTSPPAAPPRAAPGGDAGAPGDELPDGEAAPDAAEAEASADAPAPETAE
ncbi:hypothetical protein [Qipengyuania sp. ASV99]|uniref:hypothetical protein n=1 Tax=Qipengyuania sp. ASV99 TaxID=3399681 RepID=UPI003A4C676A